MYKGSAPLKVAQEQSVMSVGKAGIAETLKTIVLEYPSSCDGDMGAIERLLTRHPEHF